MKSPIKLYLLILSFTISFGSCSHSDKSREDGKIFHAAPSTGGIGSLYFALFNDKTYQICNSGGIGQLSYSGNFILKKDTLTLIALDKEIPVNSNRFLIKRYADQDSSFWNWKYSKAMASFTWQYLKLRDTVTGNTGDVYQLNDNNELMKDATHFVIRLDSLKKYQ
jgi:hypothetical protein